MTSLTDVGKLAGGDVLRAYLEENGSVQISSLTDGSPLQSTDEFIVARGGADYKIPGSAIQPLTTKGDLYAYGSGAARLAVGAQGYYLTSDSAQTLGLGWNRPLSVLDVKLEGGCKVDNATDDTTNYQAAIGNAAAAGAILLQPAGTSIVSGLTIPAGVLMCGVNGFSPVTSTYPATMSKLKLKAASTSPLLAPDDSPAVSSGVTISDLLLDTNSIAQSAINMADLGSSTARFWTMQRLVVINSGFSSGTPGAHINVGQFNEGCILRDSNLTSNNAAVTTQGAHGYNGISWYGTDGLIDNVFVGCYGQTGISVAGGASDITLLIYAGGTYWNTTGISIGGTGTVINGVSIDHNYNDGIYAAYPFAAFGCTFHSNSLQTNNTWSHIRVAASVPATLVGCRQAPQDGDAGSNVCAYFINANAGASVADLGNYQDSGATLGTGWTNWTNTSTAVSANNQTGTTYTLVATDAGEVVELNNASAVTLTVPPNSSVAFPVGTVIELFQQGAGQVTVSPGSGVTIRSDGSKTKIAAQYGTASLRKRATDEWVLSGDLA